MKKIILVLSVSFVLFSCSKNKEQSKNGDQIEASKKELLEMGASMPELAKYKFDVIEAFDKDIYNMIIKAQYKLILEGVGNSIRFKGVMQDLDSVMKYMESTESHKTFYKVHAFRIAGDTLNDKTIFLDDKNEVLYTINEK